MRTTSAFGTEISCCTHVVKMLVGQFRMHIQDELVLQYTVWGRDSSVNISCDVTYQVIPN